jgi:PadR family transcriptional regulator
MDDAVRAQLPLKPLEFLVLAVLEEGALHGYAMVQRIAARTDGILRVRPGDLYRVLYRLERRGSLKTVAAPASGGGEERRTYYGLTDLGRAVLEAEAQMLQNVASGVGRGRKPKASLA